MKFGPVPVSGALGAIVVHGIRKDDLLLKKGAVIAAADIAAMQAAGLDEIVVVRLEENDIPEDAAATEIASAIADGGIAIDHPFTGRCNLFAGHAGVLVVDKQAIDRFNAVDEAITFATLPANKPVVAGEMVATVKVIPFAVEKAKRDAALAVVKNAPPLVRIAPYKIGKVGVVSTLLPGLSGKVVDKTLKITADRLAPAGARIIADKRVRHEQAALAQAIAELLDCGAELVIVFGASAIADRRDVIPAAIEQAGGEVTRFGIPVDPGNLMLVGDANGCPILGAPGCARSPKENGFDWILMPLLAGLPMSHAEMTGMGVGGLLMDVVTRSQAQPRDLANSDLVNSDLAHEDKKIAGLILAAGGSTRMVGSNKLLTKTDGRPLVRIAAEQALASCVSPVIVVTGHQRKEVESALAGLDVRFVHNPAYAEGLSTSLRSGIAALPGGAGGIVVLPPDMPQIDAALIDRLIAAFEPKKGAQAVVPTIDGKRVSPVLWSRRFFPELMELEGDVGAWHLIVRYAEAVVEVPVTGEAVSTKATHRGALRAHCSGSLAGENVS